MVHAQIDLIDDLQTDEWWQDATVAMLESVRKKLRTLVRFIETRNRKVLYTDFQDELGEDTAIDLLGVEPQASLARFRSKVQAFLRQHEDNIAIHRLSMNKPLTATDLDELESMLLENGIADSDHIQQAKDEAHGLGLFVRSLVGLDRGTAKEAFADFLGGKTLNANQIQFINHIVDHLTQRGVMAVDASPFTDISPHGPDDLFASPRSRTSSPSSIRCAQPPRPANHLISGDIFYKAKRGLRRLRRRPSACQGGGELA